MPDARKGLLRAGLVALLIGAYVFAWHPVREMLTQRGVRPALQAVETPRAAQFMVENAGGLNIPVKNSRGHSRTAFRAPGGVMWLLPAAVLLALFPQRLYWFYLWLLHLGLGVLSVAAIAAGIGWSDAGFAAEHFLRTYAGPAISFAVPVLMWRHGKAATPAENEPDTSQQAEDTDPGPEESTQHS